MRNQIHAMPGELHFYERRMVRDVTWRTHRDWRFSSGTTIRNGPSDADKRVPVLAVCEEDYSICESGV
jgi:hypothetical protein